MNKTDNNGHSAHANKSVPPPAPPPITLKGLLGGAFNPIHVGHLRMALETTHQVMLEHIDFLPTPTPGHKIIDGAPYKDRRTMLELALAPHPRFNVNRIEENLPSPHYTLQTLRAIRRTVDQHTHLCWIMGADSLHTFEQWHQWQKLFDLTHFIIIDRPVTTPLSPALTQALADRWVSSPDALRNTNAGKFLRLNSPALDISSTTIRHKCELSEPLDYLVPQTVIDYITQNRLYLR